MGGDVDLHVYMGFMGLEALKKDMGKWAAVG
jgi:hypothetical protein